MSNVIPQRVFYNYPTGYYIIPFMNIPLFISGIILKIWWGVIAMGVFFPLSIYIIYDLIRYYKEHKKEGWIWDTKKKDYVLPKTNHLVRR